MAYRYGDRTQMNLFPQSIEDYVPQDDPVRAYDAFVESLELTELGIIDDENQVGNPEYEPKSMIKLLVYGYSYGIRSSRKLERAAHHNISFIWLVGGLKPDHKTIARFRADNKRALKNILKQNARMCIKLGLIEGNTLFVDGTKIRANASPENTWTQDKCERYLKNIDEHIESILQECANTDEKEQNNESLVKLNSELKDKEVLKTKIREIMKELKEQQRKSINTTDNECTNVKGRQGIHLGFNGQIVVDEKHGLIVSSDVVKDANDRAQFASQIERANETLGHICQNACADTGYDDTDELKKIADKGISVIVPPQQQPEHPFSKEHFKYDSVNNCYICPKEQKLAYSHFDKSKNMNIYTITSKSLCRACEHFGFCTISTNGRHIKRLINEDAREKLKTNFKKEESQAIFRLRKQKVELPFGHIKRNLGVSTFLLRGLDGVKAEMSLLSSCFNMSRLISIVGVPTLVAKLMT